MGKEIMIVKKRCRERPKLENNTGKKLDMFKHKNKWKNKQTALKYKKQILLYIFYSRMLTSEIQFYWRIY